MSLDTLAISVTIMNSDFFHCLISFHNEKGKDSCICKEIYQIDLRKLKKNIATRGNGFNQSKHKY